MNLSRPTRLLATLASALPVILCGCAHLEGSSLTTGATNSDPVFQAIQGVQQQFAPDMRLAIFRVGAERHGHELVLTGDVDRVEARIAAVRAVEQTGAKVTDRIQVLPDPRLGEQLWGISCLSVASGRLQPEHKGEMGTQVLMGDVVRVWKRSTNAVFAWYLTQSREGYLSWLQKGTFVRCTREQVDAWNAGPLLIITASEGLILEQPAPAAQPVSDVVICDLVRKIGEQGDWYHVELPDKRSGFLPRKDAQDFSAWKQARRPTPENIESTARRFIGRPYLWGGNSPKGFDCSGFTRTVFYLNGIELERDSSQQARQGVAVPLDDDLSHLKKGDLLFFGRPSRRDGREKIVHVGIYLGNKLFIHSSEWVHISSLDPRSPLADRLRIRSLLCARRVLPE